MKLQINESQNIEFKQTWRDEYIKWLSAFGNTDGGKLYIGVDNDDEIKGIDNAFNFAIIINTDIKFSTISIAKCTEPFNILISPTLFKFYVL